MKRSIPNVIQNSAFDTASAQDLRQAKLTPKQSMCKHMVDAGGRKDGDAGTVKNRVSSRVRYNFNILFLLIFGSHPLFAATDTWTGATATWNTIANWSSGIPVNGDALVFPNTAITFSTNNNIPALAPASIAIDSPTAYTLAGNSLSFSAGSIAVTQVSGSAAHTISLPMVITGATTLTVTQSCSDPLTLSGIISQSGGNGNLLVNGSQTVVLSAVNTYSGTTTISGTATLQTGVSFALSTNTDVTVNAGATFDLDNSTQVIGSLAGAGDVLLGSGGLATSDNNSTTFSGVISGTGALSKEGTGTLKLSGVNTYTGATTIFAGTLQAGAAGVLSASTDVNVMVSNVFDLNNFNQTIGSLAGAGDVTLGTATLTTADNSSTTYSGVMSGTGGLIKQGTGTLTLSGANSYQGGTTLQNGTVSISANNNLGNLASSITFTGGTLETTATFSSGRPITLSTSGTFNTDPGTTLTLTNVISGLAGTLTKTGTGTLILSGANTYAGATSISTGTLQAGAATVLSSSTDVTVSSGAIFNLNNFNQTIGSLGGAGDVTLGTATLTTADNSSTTYSGVMSGTGGLSKDGTGTLTLSGVNTYTGATTISNGTLRTGVAFALAALTDLTVDAGATFDLNNFSQFIGSLAGAGLVTLGSANLETGDNNSTTYSGVMSGTGSFSKIGTGTLILSGASTYAGGTFIGGGTISISADDNLGNATGSVEFAGGTLETTATFSSARGISLAGSGTFQTDTGTALTLTGIISGAAGLIKTGTGTLILNGANTYGGTTSISAGTLQASATGVLPSTTDVTVSSGAIFNLNSFDQTIGSLAGAGNVTLGSATLTTADNNSTTYSGVMSAAGAFIKQGTGTLILTGLNSYSGGTTVSAGTLQVSANTLPGNVLNNATLVFNQTSPGTYAGAITGTGAMIIQGNSILTYTGVGIQTSTTVTSGSSLLVNNSLTSPVANQAGATLGGTGTITGLVTNDGTVAPGASIGTLNIVGNYIQNSASTLAIEVAPSGSDLLNISGTATINPGSTLQLTFDPGSYAIDQMFTIMDAAGGLTGTFSTVTNLTPAVSFEVLYTPTMVELLANYISFSQVIAPYNPASVAGALDTLLPTASGDLMNVILDLATLSYPELIDALDHLHPAMFKGFTLTQQESSIAVRKAFSDHVALFSLTDCTKCMSQKKWHVWATVLGDFQRQHQRPFQQGYHSGSAMGILGADYRVDKHLYVGLGGAYSDTSTHWTEHRGSGSIQSWYSTLYTSFLNRHFFANASLIGFFSGFHGNRRIDFPDISRTATHHNRGAGILTHLDTGVKWEPSDLLIALFGSADYLYQHENSYTEKHAESLNLHVKDCHATMLRAEGGINFAKCFRVKSSKWIPGFGLSYVREQRFSGRYYQAKFVGTDVLFRIKGLRSNRNLFSPKAELTGILFHDNLSMSLGYEGEFGTHYHDQIVRLQVNFALGPRPPCNVMRKEAPKEEHPLYQAIKNWFLIK